MTLQFHDTATRSVRAFTPLQPGQVSVYLCGATVQAPPHIGHMRSGACFDVLNRWLAQATGQLGEAASESPQAQAIKAMIRATAASPVVSDVVLDQLRAGRQ